MEEQSTAEQAQRAGYTEAEYAAVVRRVAQVAREGAANERALVDRLAQAREGLRSGDLNRQLQANAELNRVLALAESNPQFRSTDLYANLMAEVEGSENRINVARQR